MKQQIQELLNQYTLLMQQDNKQTQENYARFQYEVSLLELGEEIAALDKILNSNKDFSAAFKKRCALRNQNHKGSFIPFSECPDSPANHLYWHIAEHVFQPATMHEMLAILLPNIRHLIQIAHDDTELPQYRQRNMELLNSQPAFEELSYYVLAGQNIFDARDITSIPFQKQIQVYEALAPVPELREKLYQHNTSLQELSVSMRYRQGMPLGVVLRQLIPALFLNHATNVDEPIAQEQYTNILNRFLSYLKLLPQDLQKEFGSLQYGHDSFEHETTFQRFIDQGYLRVDIDIEVIVHPLQAILKQYAETKILCDEPLINTEHYDQWQEQNIHAKSDRVVQLPQSLVKQVLQTKRYVSERNSIAFLLLLPTQFYKLFLSNNYHTNLLCSLIGYGHFNPMQEKALATALGKIYAQLTNAENRESLRDILFILIMAGPNILFNHLPHLKQSFLTDILLAKDPEFIKTVLSHIPAKDLEKTTYDGDDDQTIFHILAYCSDGVVFRTFLEHVPQSRRLKALSKMDLDGNIPLFRAAANPELLQIIIELLPEHQRSMAMLKQNREGFRTLHAAAGNAESLKLALQQLSEEQQYTVVHEVHRNDFTLLHYAAGDPEALKMILSYYPREQKITAIQTAGGYYNNTVLHCAANHPGSLAILLALYPEDDVFSVLHIKNDSQETVVHCAASNPESFKMLLSLCPPKERVKVLTEKNHYGNMILLQITSKQELLDIVFELVPQAQWLNLITATSTSGNTMLYGAVYNAKLLEFILSKISPEQRFDVLKMQNREGKTLLHHAFENNAGEESIETICKLVSENQMLDLMRIPNKRGNTVLQDVAHHPRRLNSILKCISASQHSVLVESDEYKLLRAAAADANSLNIVLSLYPEQERASVIKKAALIPLAVSVSGSFQKIFSFYSQEERHVLAEQTGLLEAAIIQIDSLKTLLSHYSQDPARRLAAIQEANLLHKAVCKNRKSFKILWDFCPETHRKAELQRKDEKGNTVLHYLPHSLSGGDLLHHLFASAHYSDDEKVQALGILNGKGESVLHGAYISHLREILEKLPVSHRQAALRIVDRQGTSVLEYFNSKRGSEIFREDVVAIDALIREKPVSDNQRGRFFSHSKVAVKRVSEEKEKDTFQITI